MHNLLQKYTNLGIISRQKEMKTSNMPCQYGENFGTAGKTLALLIPSWESQPGL